MPLDPGVARFLREFGPQIAFPAEALADPGLAGGYLADARARLAAPAASPREPVHQVFDDDADGIAVRVYRASGAGGAPLVAYLHGGGWVSGGLEMNDALCRRLANLTGCVLVSVDYRLAPEHPYPAPLEDSLAALAWSRREAERLGADPGHVSVAGSSSGGNLAAAVALAARDRGEPLRAQVLLYPVLDAAMATPSYTANGEGYLLSREQMRWYWDQYLPGHEAGAPPYAAPAASTDLSGLAPAVVVTAEFDPLRDEGEQYAGRLVAAGVPTEQLRADGLIHGFLTFLGQIAAADAEITRIVAATRRAWAASS